LTNPKFDPIKIQTHFLVRTLGNRVKKSNALNKSAISASLTVCHRDVIEGSLLASAPGQSDGYHTFFLYFCFFAPATACKASQMPHLTPVLMHLALTSKRANRSEPCDFSP
jgi:hypothetical protein